MQESLATWERMKKEELHKKTELQRKFCEDNKYDQWVDEGTMCDKCYLKILFYYSEKDCSTKHLTCCPLCHRSLLD